MQIKLEVNDSQEQRRLRQMALLLDNPLPFMKTWANGVAKKARSNALAKGGRNFWREVAASCRVRKVDRDSAEVFADKPGSAIKQFGGVIRPDKMQALTIPIAAEAQGKVAREFKSKGLFVVKTERMDAPDTKGILGYSENDEFHPLFALRTKSTQEPDPWWPTPEETAAIGIDEAVYWLEKQGGISS